MKMKKIALTFGLFAAVLPTFAQYEQIDSNTDLTDTETLYKVSYIGSDALEDPGKQVGGYVTMMQMYYNSENWGEMYENWKWLIKNAPIASVSIYARGSVMLGKLIQAETDTAKKKQYLDELMNLFDTRLKYLKYLNASIPEGKRGRALHVCFLYHQRTVRAVQRRYRE